MAQQHIDPDPRQGRQSLATEVKDRSNFLGATGQPKTPTFKSVPRTPKPSNRAGSR